MKKSARILVADDELDLLWALQHSLVDDGFEVITAGNGVEALSQVYKHNPNLLILDVNMPGMDGMECARRILEIDPEARIVMFSGYEPAQHKMPDLLERKLLKGYLTKPTDIAELSQFLAKVLQETT